MRRRITAGNDAPFRWAVKLQGKPFDLSGKDVKVYVINSRGEIPVARLTIEGNEVSGVFEGRYQTRLGEHSLSLRINEGRPEMKTAAVANVFELVQWSADAGGSDEGDVIVAPIVVESEITAGILAEYTKKDEFDSAVQTLSDQLEQKVNMEEGKTLSTNDFTNALKAKLESLSNYDDQELREAINAIESTIDTLIGDNASKKIESFNEIIRFLEGVEDTESLEGIVAGIQQSIAKKADASVVVSLAEEVQTLKTEVESQNELIEDLQNTKIDKEADDYYPQLSVGLADNLSGVDVVDSEVNFRRSGGGAISDGVARIEAIKGNSVVWNQLYKPSASVIGTQVINGVTFSVYEDGTIEANGTAEGGTAYIGVMRYEGFLTSHKYLLVAFGAPVGKWSNQGLYFGGIGSLNTLSMIGSEGYKIFQPDVEGRSGLSLSAWAGYSLSCKFRPIFCDLTKMFGAGNEPTTIEEFYARKPMGVDLNAYNEGEVIHMDVQSIEPQGVNAWDEEWEVGTYNPDTGALQNSTTIIRSKNFINVFPNVSYYIKTPASIGAKSNLRVYYYDNSNNYLGCSVWLRNGTSIITTPTNCAYITFVIASITSYDHDICINLSDTSINGKYFPYIKRVEDLSIIRKYFPNGMKSAGSAHDEIRYNKVTQKWEYSKGRFRSVDLGTCDWKQDESDATRFRTLANTWKATYTNNLLCEKYATAPTQDISLPDKSIAMTNSQTAPLFRVKDSAYTDAASFKAAMQGVILYYESNDWEWVELDAEDQFKDLDYQVWNCGTERAIAEGKSAPLAADITYGFNAIGKIKELESLVAALRAKVGI